MPEKPAPHQKKEFKGSSTLLNSVEDARIQLAAILQSTQAYSNVPFIQEAVVKTVELALKTDKYFRLHIWNRAKEVFGKELPPLLEEKLSSKSFWAFYLLLDGAEAKRPLDRMKRLRGSCGVWPFECQRKKEVVTANSSIDRCGLIAHNLYQEYFRNQQVLEEFFYTEPVNPTASREGPEKNPSPQTILGLTSFEDRGRNLLNWYALETSSTTVRDWDLTAPALEKRARLRTPLEKQTILFTREILTLDAKGKPQKKVIKHFMRMTANDGTLFNATDIQAHLRLTMQSSNQDDTGTPCKNPLFEVALVENNLPEPYKNIKALTYDAASVAIHGSVAKVVVEAVPVSQSASSEISGFTLLSNHVPLDANHAQHLQIAASEGYAGRDSAHKTQLKKTTNDQSNTQTQMEEKQEINPADEDVGPIEGFRIFSDVWIKKSLNPWRKNTGFTESLYSRFLEPGIVQKMRLVRELLASTGVILNATIETMALTLMHDRSSYTCVSPNNELPLGLALVNNDKALLSLANAISSDQMATMDAWINASRDVKKLIPQITMINPNTNKAIIFPDQISYLLENQNGASIFGNFSEYLKRTTNDVDSVKRKNSSIVSLLGSYVMDNLTKVTKLTLSKCHAALFGNSQQSGIGTPDGYTHFDNFGTALSSTVEHGLSSMTGPDKRIMLTHRYRHEYKSIKEKDFVEFERVAKENERRYTDALNRICNILIIYGLALKHKEIIDKQAQIAQYPQNSILGNAEKAVQRYNNATLADTSPSRASATALQPPPS